ncbi:hypothetical protein [Paenibacillus sp. YYML68]|uniref:hypothetical protein n=1 Tax=Paenibacillus sp. YYML68 TaxID=2909250 RepID=UPI00248FAD67|nr:hypothetical protein [Paenibacillus sp. YYML68]
MSGNSDRLEHSTEGGEVQPGILHEAHERLASQVTASIYEANPQLLERYGERGKQKCWEDNVHHMKHLDTAYQLSNEDVFTDYALWLNGILGRFGMGPEHLVDNFERIADALDRESSLSSARVSGYKTLLQRANEALQVEARKRS